MYTYYLTCFEKDPKKWRACLKTVYDKMIAEGWSKHAKKLREVQDRRARRLFLDTQ